MAGEVSVKELVAAIAEAQRPMFEQLGKTVADAVEKNTKEAREESVNELVKQAKTDPNAAKFLPMLLMTPSERQKALDSEAKEARERGAGLKFGRMLRATALCRLEHGGNMAKIPNILADLYGDKAMAEAVSKAPPMTSGDPAAGGFLGQETVASELIPLLRAATFLGQLGARPYPMPTDKVHVPRLETASSAGWIGETKQIPASKPSVGRTSLSAKKLGAIVAISNDLLHDTSGQADAVVRDDLVKVTSIEIEPKRQEEAKETLRSLGLSEFVSFIRDDAARVMSTLGEMEFVLLDCEKEDYIRFFDKLPLSPRAIVVADNILSHDMVEYVAHVRDLPGGESITLPVGKGLEVTRLR